MPKFNIRRKTSPVTRSTIVHDLPELGIVEIIHSQSIRQSINYQSAEAMYGAKVKCHKDETEIERTIAIVEKIVEEALLVKFHDQNRVLTNIAKENR